MTGPSEKVSNFLAHYSSPNYDPDKAREYYLRTRELKGRKPKLSAETHRKQSEANLYVRDRLGAKRKADLAKNAENSVALRNASEAQAKAHKERMEKIQATVAESVSRIEKQLSDKLAGIQKQLKIPPNASPKLRAFLEKQQRIQSNSAKVRSQSERRSLHKSLRSAVSKAREDYTASRIKISTDRKTNAEDRRSIVEKYKTDLETETRNIKEQVR